ncbi:hypothetical protein CSUI_008321, partial [Cystoisospora suis]
GRNLLLHSFSFLRCLLSLIAVKKQNTEILLSLFFLRTHGPPSSSSIPSIFVEVAESLLSSLSRLEGIGRKERKRQRKTGNVSQERKRRQEESPETSLLFFSVVAATDRKSNEI